MACQMYLDGFSVFMWCCIFSVVLEVIFYLHVVCHSRGVGRWEASSVEFDEVWLCSAGFLAMSIAAAASAF